MKTEEIKNMAHALLAVQESQFQYVVPEEIEAQERTAFHGAAAGAAKAGKSHFSFKGKKYPVTMKKDVATKIADSVEHDEEGVMEANAPKGTHTPNNGSPMGQGLSPSAKQQVDNKTPTSQEIDEPTVDKLNFQKFRTMTKKSKMRPGDNEKGDTTIIPSGTPMKGPAAMKSESFDKTVKAIGAAYSSMYEKASVPSTTTKVPSTHDKYTHEVDYAEAGARTAKKFVAHAQKAGIKAKIHTNRGPGGGHPVVHLGHSDESHVHRFLKKHYDHDLHKDDMEMHRIHENASVPSTTTKTPSTHDKYTHEVDYAESGPHTAKKFVAHAQKAGIKAKIHTMNGPGGGHPVVHLGHSDESHVHRFLKKHYDSGISKSDMEMHRM